MLYIEVIRSLFTRSILDVNGHFSSIFMIYCLFNPFMIEILLRVGSVWRPDGIRLYIVAC